MSIHRSFLKLSAVIVVASVATALSASGASAAFIGKRGSVFVAGHKPGQADTNIWEVDPATGRLVANQTGHNGTRDSDPVVSPEGGPHIAFVGRPRSGGPGEIYVVDRDSPGSGAPRIFRLTRSSADDSDPAWSPGGGKLVWSRDAGGPPTLWITNLVGTEQAPLKCCRGVGAEHPIQGTAPAWSPSGEEIAYVSPAGEICITRVDGRVPIRCTIRGDQPNWDPTGKRIAFTRDGDLHLLGLGADGSARARLVLEAARGTARIESPAFSPDGGLVIFVVGGVVRSVDPDRLGSARRLTAGLIAASADWQPACHIRGTNGRDVLTGTDEPELICGRRGDDVIRAGGGGDRVFAGEGDDVIYAGPGDDFVLGGKGGDSNHLIGGPGNDHLEGGVGNDRIEDRGRNSGTDDIQGQPGNDVILADDGDAGNGDVVGGGEGRDRCVADTKSYGPYPHDLVWGCEVLTTSRQLR